MRRSVCLAMLLCLACVSIPSAMAQPPVPALYSGFSQGSGDVLTTVWLEGFLDLQCPDSKASWPVVKQVLAAYSGELAFTFHLFPLPYHHNSFFMAQAAFSVANYKAELVWNFIDAAFAQQSKFYNYNSNNTTPNQMIQELVSIAGSVGVPEEAFMSCMMYDDKCDESTRVAWKYGCSRTVYGTPLYYVNGVAVNAQADWTLAQWEQLLNPIINATRSS